MSTATAAASAAPGLTPADIASIIREATDQLILEDAMSILPFKEKTEWRLKPGFPTAAWSFSGSDTEPGTHTIYMGDGMFSQARSGLTREELVAYAKAYGHHERDGHARATVRGKKNVDELLRPLMGTKRKIPFPLFNLFEDARIEYRQRRIGGAQLNWRQFEKPPELADGAELRPESVLFYIIQSEAEDEALEDEWLAAAMKRDETLTRRVFDYYQRIVAAPDSWHLRPLMLEWLNEFVPPEDEESSGDASGPMAESSELELGYGLSVSPGDKASFDAGTEVLEGPGKSGMPKDGPPGKGQGELDSIRTESEGESNLLAAAPVAKLNMAEVSQLARRLEKAFWSPSVARDSEDATPELCIENLLLADTRGRAWQEGRAKGRAVQRRIALVMDCSGSMMGGPVEEGRKLIAALSLLAKRGVLTGEVLLTAVVGSKSQWLRLQLPINRRDIERIHAFAAAEGIEAALRRNVTSLARCHRVFLYSDGAICDAQPDKSWLRARGVEVIGLYCGTEESAVNLATHTRKVIVRSTPMALATAMVKQLK